MLHILTFISSENMINKEILFRMILLNLLNNDNGGYHVCSMSSIYI